MFAPGSYWRILLYKETDKMVNQKDETLEFDLEAVFDVEDYLYF